jgi:hypothetical protein
MAFSRDAVLKFRQSTAADVVANRIRVRPANTPFAADEPFVDVPVDPSRVGEDGFTRIPFTLFAAEDLDGRYDVHVTAIDDAGGESTALEVDDQDFDFVLPDAPTEGSVESGQ